MSENDPAKMLRICADDPMWASHCEMTKSLAYRAADTIDGLRAALADARAVLGQARFCLRELAPIHPDSQMTVRMIDAALRDK